jgi:hypothetical protein
MTAGMARCERLLFLKNPKKQSIGILAFLLREVSHAVGFPYTHADDAGGPRNNRLKS